MRNRSSDLHRDLEISLKQAGEGLTTSLTIGTAERECNFQVRVPPGVDTGSRLRFGGKGEPGIGNERPGDLYIVRRVSEHERFSRKGSDLHTKVEVSPEQPEHGSQILIETLLDGSKYIQIPPNAKTGDIFRIHGLGMLGLRVRGDLYVTLAYRK